MNNLPLDFENCPISKVSKVLQGKWAMVIIYVLSEGTLRFSEIHHKLPHITEANLTKDLRMLESYGVIHKEVYPVVPPKVEYSLTEIGKTIEPIINLMSKWGAYYRNL